INMICKLLTVFFQLFYKIQTTDILKKQQLFLTSPPIFIKKQLFSQFNVTFSTFIRHPTNESR
ncbi:MAG TPA: hypothetical protein DEP71_00955, partial [Porphyromonadaceae bacterium]|nr:hypothetical protein [Porphyromonadaceae bacterium]HBF96853.1 hypothetical protein [Porphyromonadaceae bacterium]HCB87842.1 hypothetical protein [Porphyromonadaceae bacterium]HCF82090.1 hypothetical protein [Porphyromonadaceae bacterium]